MPILWDLWFRAYFLGVLLIFLSPSDESEMEFRTFCWDLIIFKKLATLRNFRSRMKLLRA